MFFSAFFSALLLLCGGAAATETKAAPHRITTKAPPRQQTPVAHLKATPSVIQHSGDSVTIAWTGVMKACPTDTISMFIEPHRDTEQGFLSVTNSAGTWTQGFGSVSMPLVNVRAAVRFAYVSRCLPFVAVELASVHVTFADLFEPTQLHLALTQRNSEMRMMFTTAAPPKQLVPIAEVQALDASFQPSGPVRQFNGTSHTYAAKDMCGQPANKSGNYIDVGVFHDVLVTGLLPAAIYQYRVGVTNLTMSQWRPFVAAPRVGADVSVDIVMFGDMGVQTPFEHPSQFQNWGVQQQYGAPGSVYLIERYVAEGVPTFKSAAAKSHHTDTAETTRLRNVARRWGAQGGVHAPTVSPRLVLDIGDISYARGLGVLWEYFMDSIDNAAGSAPFMVGVGNHEQDYPGQAFNPPDSGYGDDSLGECSVPYGNRFHMPSPDSTPLPVGRTRNMWYSFNYGPVHFTFMSSEHDFLIGSPQYKWIEADLAAVNRTLTPWLILLSHRPFYTASAGGQSDTLNTLLRQQIGALAHQYKVDIVFTGHVHTWERTCGVNEHGVCQTRDEDGVVYIVGGCAGNDFQVAWVNEAFASHVILPPWSVFVTIEHGVSEMRANGTNLELIYIASRRGEVHDRVTLSK
jgi:hypothetical protein